MCRPNDHQRNLKFGLVLVLLFCLIATPAFTSSRAAVQRDKSSQSVNRTEQAAPVATAPSSTTAAQAQERYGKTSLYFEANHGQTDQRVNFITHANGATVFLTNTEAVFVLSAPDANAAARPRDSMDAMSAHAAAPVQTPRQLWALRMKIEGANAQSEVIGLEQQPGIVNYFIGDDTAKWHANVPTYARVHYASVYPGIDLVYYGNQQQMEYDFVVQPGADTAPIALNFEGANSLAVGTNGDLLIETGVGTVRQQKPLVYQELNGVRRTIASGYQLKGDGRVGFSVGAHDRNAPLIIDPVMAYSTFLGGEGFDFGRSIVVDAKGQAYVSGQTSSMFFPTTAGAFAAAGGTEVYVTKLNAAGSGLIYSTFLGGQGSDVGFGLAVDAAGSAYVTGSTSSADFPTTAGAFATVAPNLNSAFVSKLNATGSALVYSTYLGGSNGDSTNAIAVDTAGSAYVIGVAFSADFPTTPGAFDTSRNGVTDAFVTRFNAAGSALTYSTFLGGSNTQDFAQAIEVDSDGNAYVTGSTNSTDFPTVNPLQPAYAGGSTDAYLAKLNPNASGAASLVYSTYLGGTGNEQGNDIAIDAARNFYVTGSTSSADFPVSPSAFSSTLSSGLDAFVTKVEASGSDIVYSTFLGGTANDNASAIALDSSGNAYIHGVTASTDFPVVEPLQPTSNGGSEAFVTKLDGAGEALSFSTYLGGGSTDIAEGIAVDSAGNFYVSGDTQSADFPRSPSAFQSAKNGGQDAFITKYGDYVITGRTIDSSGNPIAAATVSLGGSNSAVTQTDASGSFVFLDTTPLGTHTIAPSKAGFTFNPPFSDELFLDANREFVFIGSGPPATPTPTPTPTPGPASVQIAFDNYIADEDCGRLEVAVTRSGDTATAATIDFATADDTAKQKGDYGITLGTISFAPGDTTKTITLLITEDEFVEGDEKFTLNLFNPTGAATLAEPSRTTITIVDDDTTATNVNPIDDTEAFVCQHYHDFLNREPDTAGELFWINNIESCGADAACRELKRTDTSAAFFLSIEFQGTGFYAIRLQRTAFGKRSDTAATRMTYDALVRDSRQLGEGVIVGEAGADVKLAQNKQAYATQVVTSAAFIDRFPTAQTAAQYVDALYASAEVTPTATERADAITAFGGGGTAGRVAALRQVVESQSIINAEVNPAFVLLQYHGYLRRNPTDLPDTDDSGYQFWLTKLNSFSGDFRKADMVKAFITSAEYRQRFGQQ
jgi:hypothetical protein